MLFCVGWHGSSILTYEICFWILLCLVPLIVLLIMSVVNESLETHKDAQ